MTAALEGGEWSAARPGRTLPSWKTRYPFYRRLGGPQGRSGRAENLVSTGIRSRTVQPVAQSLYWLSYPAHNIEHKEVKKEVTVIFEIHIVRQSLTQHLFYIQWYICQGDMFRPSRSSSGPSRTEIQALFSFSALWDLCSWRAWGWPTRSKHIALTYIPFYIKSMLC